MTRFFLNMACIGRNGDAHPKINILGEHIFLAIGVICLFVSIVIAFVAGSCYYKHIYK